MAFPVKGCQFRISIALGISVASWRPRFLSYQLGYHLKWWKISWFPNCRQNCQNTFENPYWSYKANMWNQNLHYFLPLSLFSRKFTQECLKHLATKKQQQVGNITQIEDAAEKLKASGGFFLILVEMSTSLLRHRVLPNMEPGKMKTNVKGGFGGVWSLCNLGDPFEEKAQN